jgi:hypothetical protein
LFGVQQPAVLLEFVFSADLRPALVHLRPREHRQALSPLSLECWVSRWAVPQRHRYELASHGRLVLQARPQQAT